MREILFRGKDEKTGKFIFGDLRHFNNEVRIVGKSGYSHIVDPETVGQFTGLTDKNGVKIFEGDILDYGVLYKKTTIVTFDKGCFMHDTNVLFIGCDAMEIIGNIHENH